MHKTSPNWFLTLVALLSLPLLACALGGAPPAATPTVTAPAAAPATEAPQAPATTAPTTSPEPAPTDTPPLPPMTPTRPPLLGDAPSYRVGAFYYPWYGSPDQDGEWVHWDEPYFRAPQSISSDYYPLLGPYSANDPAVVAQHLAWLRQAGVGVVISSWWGRNTYEDRAVPLLLEQAETYGLKVAFHIEPYDGRTADRLFGDLLYLYQQYGDHPAFFRSTASSRFSPDDRPKGLFFVWNTRHPDNRAAPVEGSYWAEALDRIHNLDDGGLVIAQVTEGAWVEAGHFDGAYNYATLELDLEDRFAWAQALAPGAWYIPSVLPGFSARRINYPAEAYTPRREGQTYADQWAAALGTGVEPAMVTITSFNEWHEGSQIEPAAAGAVDHQGEPYLDFGPLPPEGYLDLTRGEVERFLAAEWPPTYAARLQLSTSSDWSSLRLVGGGRWTRPDLLSTSPESAAVEIIGNTIHLGQPIDQAEAGAVAQITLDCTLVGLDPEAPLQFTIERGDIGWTQLQLFRFVNGEASLVQTVYWENITGDGVNRYAFQIPSAPWLEDL